MMDKHLFSMQCNKLAKVIKCSDDVNEDGFLTPLWDAFKGYDQKRFAEAVEFLCDTWHYRKFPLRADFNDAMRATVKQNTYKETPLNDDISEFSKDILALAERFRPQQKKDSPIKQAVLREKMRKKGLVYSIEESKWVSKDDVATIGGSFIDP